VNVIKSLNVIFLSVLILVKTGEIKMVKGYCVKCKKKNVEMKNAKAVTMKNGRKATKGECPTCGSGMYRIGG